VLSSGTVYYGVQGGCVTIQMKVIERLALG